MAMSSIKVSIWELLKHIFKFLESGISLASLAENESLIAAHDVLDAILEVCAKHEYEKYLKPKLRPYAALSVTAE